MNYLKRQYGLWHFVRRVREIYDDSDLANNYLSKNQIYKKIVRNYFVKQNPLEDKENQATFPWGTKEFKNSIKNGHSLESMESNLEFLKKEFDSYFEELLERKIIKENNDIPPQYFLNRNSHMVYWEIAALDIGKFFWEIVSVFKGK